MYFCCFVLVAGFVGSLKLLPTDVKFSAISWGYFVGWVVFVLFCTGVGVLCGRRDAKLNHTDGLTETCLGAVMGGLGGVIGGFDWPAIGWLILSSYLLFWIVIPWTRRAPNEETDAALGPKSDG